MTHEEETANFLGDPINDYCVDCLCSCYCTDDDCTCECHGREYEDYGDWED